MPDHLFWGPRRLAAADTFYHALLLRIAVRRHQDQFLVLSKGQPLSGGAPLWEFSSAALAHLARHSVWFQGLQRRIWPPIWRPNPQDCRTGAARVSALLRFSMP